MLLLALRSSLPLLLLRSSLPLLLLRRRLALLLLRWRLALLLLRRRLALLRLLNLLALLLLRWRLALLLLLNLLPLLLLLNLLALLLLLNLLALLLLRSSLTLLLLRRSLTLLLLRSLLPLLLLRRRLTLLLLLNRLPLLLLRSCLTLLLLLNRLALLLLRSLLPQLLLRSRLALLLLRSSLIAHRRYRWGPHIAIGCKRPADGHAGRAAMIHVGKLSPVGAGSTLVLHLRRHGCSVRLTQRAQFRGSRPHLDSTRSAVETYPCAAPLVPANLAVVDVVHHGGVDVIYSAVVIEVAAAPVTALVAEAYVAKTVVDAAIVADVPAPVTAVKAVTAMPEAPVAGGPECALIGSLDPRAGHPVIALWRPGPVAGRPEVVVAGSLRLVVVGQGWRRLGSVGIGLLSITRIIRSLVGRLVRAVALVRRRRALLVAGSSVGGVLRCAGVV